jgi:hypothetical protein
VSDNARDSDDYPARLNSTAVLRRGKLVIFWSQFAESIRFPTLISVNPTPEFAVGRTTKAALAYPERLHEGQCRQADGAPFIVHPIEVATLLYEAGAPDYVIAAGVLHDTLEKTDATEHELFARFGRRVGQLVCAVTDDQQIPSYARRKAALRAQVAHAGDDALAVFVADTLSKVRGDALVIAPGSRCAADSSTTTVAG